MKLPPYTDEEIIQGLRNALEYYAYNNVIYVGPNHPDASQDSCSGYFGKSGENARQALNQYKKSTTRFNSIGEEESIRECKDWSGGIDPIDYFRQTNDPQQFDEMMGMSQEAYPFFNDVTEQSMSLAIRDYEFGTLKCGDG